MSEIKRLYGTGDERNFSCKIMNVSNLLGVIILVVQMVGFVSSCRELKKWRGRIPSSASLVRGFKVTIT